MASLSVRNMGRWRKWSHNWSGGGTLYIPALSQQLHLLGFRLDTPSPLHYHTSQPVAMDSLASLEKGSESLAGHSIAGVLPLDSK